MTKNGRPAMESRASRSQPMGEPAGGAPRVSSGSAIGSVSAGKSSTNMCATSCTRGGNSLLVPCEYR